MARPGYEVVVTSTDGNYRPYRAWVRLADESRRLIGQTGATASESRARTLADAIIARHEAIAARSLRP